MNGRSLLVETVTSLFERHCPLTGRDAAGEAALGERLWKEVARADLATVGVDDARGGAGGTLGDACAVLRAAARYAPPIPLAETQLAAWLAAEAGLTVPPATASVGPVDLADPPVLDPDGKAFIAGSVPRVPFAGSVGHLVVLADRGGVPHVAVVDLSRARVEPEADLAGQPRGTVMLEDVDAEAVAPSPFGLDTLLARGALARAQQMAGALERALELSVTYAGDREQFGRPISRFQAIQHHLADAAAEAAAAAMVAQSAADLAESGLLQEAAAVAKVRAGMAARAANIAHQVHGAIGVTEEHPLHLFTRRIWAWREDFGSDLEWSTRLGRQVASAGSSGLWPSLARI